MTSTPILCEETLLHPERIEEARAALIDTPSALRLAEAFAALGDPTRVRIVSALLDRELCVCDLAALLGMTQSAVSHQLRLLRDLRLVKARKQGRVVYYTLDDRHIEVIFSLGLEHVRHQAALEVLA
jgi:ArsR family transcriptional regulator, lead/cadmium/zinc/bismuth-responsive transcriptional repressor